MKIYQKIVKCIVCNRRSNINYTIKTSLAHKKCICGVTTTYAIKQSDFKNKNL